MIDSHCHLDFKQFDADRTELLKQAQALGIAKILIPGTQACAWPKQIQLCSENSQLEYALGLHPYFLAEYQPEHLTALRDLLEAHQQDVVAVGEIGLDFAIKQDRHVQRGGFEQQLSLASEFGLPVILHQRKSHHEMIRLLKKHKFKSGGVVHGFSGSYQQAMDYVELDFKLGIGGTITYPRAKKTIDAISKVPLSSLLLETDAPDMPVCGQQGHRNSPLNLVHILESLTTIRPESRAELEQATDLNFAALFRVCLPTAG